jgi:hypothetical protein
MRQKICHEELTARLQHLKEDGGQTLCRRHYAVQLLESLGKKHTKPTNP